MTGIVLVLIAVLFASLGNMGAIRNNKRHLPVMAVNAHGMFWGALASTTVAISQGMRLIF